MIVDIGRKMSVQDRALLHAGEGERRGHVFRDWKTSRPQYERSMKNLTSAFLGRRIAEISRIPFTLEQLEAYRSLVCGHFGYSPNSYVLFWIPGGVGIEDLMSRGLQFAAGSSLYAELRTTNLRTEEKWVLAAPLSPMQKVGRGASQTLKHLRGYATKLRVPPSAITMGTFLEVAFLLLFQWHQLRGKLTDSGLLYTRTGCKGCRLTVGPWYSDRLGAGEVREKSTDTSLNTLLIVQS